VKKKKKVKRKLTVLTCKGGVSLYDENLREVIVCFKTREDVSVILINLRGGGCNYPNKKWINTISQHKKNMK